MDAISVLSQKGGAGMKKLDFTCEQKEKIESHTSKGNQPKWHLDDMWYKADHMGYEALSEYMVSRLLEKSNVTDFVTYDLVSIRYDDKEAVGCASANFRKENEMLIPIEKLHRQYYGYGLADALAKMTDAVKKIKYTVQFVEEVTDIPNVGPYLAMLLAVDAFFLNEDRHTNNIAVIRNEGTKRFRMAPIYDNGLALLSDTNDYPLNKDVYHNIEKVQAKPFDVDFDVQLEAAEQLYGTQLRFAFSDSDVYHLVDSLKGVYEDAVLKRAEKVVLEQKRKYGTYF